MLDARTRNRIAKGLSPMVCHANASQAHCSLQPWHAAKRHERGDDVCRAQDNIHRRLQLYALHYDNIARRAAILKALQLSPPLHSAEASRHTPILYEAPAQDALHLVRFHSAIHVISFHPPFKAAESRCCLGQP